MDDEKLIPAQRHINLEAMAKNAGHTLWNSWNNSANIYTLRLHIPLEERQEWINNYLTKRYFTWEEYEREQPRE